MPEYKLTENGNIAKNDDGNPVIINDDGSEYGLDAIKLSTDTSKLRHESKKWRLQLRDTQEKLKGFEGIEDPKVAIDAMETIKTLKDKDFTNKEEIERVRGEIDSAYSKKMSDQKSHFDSIIEDTNSKLKKSQDNLFDAMVATRFYNSSFFNGENAKTTATPEMAISYYGKNFKVEVDENGKQVVVGYSGGKPIYSQINPGEMAGFEEAIPKIIVESGQKIMKESTGSGSRGGSGAFRPRTIDASNHKEYMANLEDIASGKIKVKAG